MPHSDVRFRQACVEHAVCSQATKYASLLPNCCSIEEELQKVELQLANTERNANKRGFGMSSVNERNKKTNFLNAYKNVSSAPENQKVIPPQHHISDGQKTMLHSVQHAGQSAADPSILITAQHAVMHNFFYNSHQCLMLQWPHRHCCRSLKCVYQLLLKAVQLEPAA